MKKTMLTLSVLLMTGVAQAQVPDFTASCPNQITVRAENGAVFINGKSATLKNFSPTYVEAKRGNTTLSITDDNGISISYTLKHVGNGICQVDSQDTGSAQPAAEAAYNGSNAHTKPAEAACLKAVASKSGVPQSKLVLDYVSESEAATGVDFKVPHDSHIWRCLSDSRGHVQDVSRV